MTDGLTPQQERSVSLALRAARYRARAERAEALLRDLGADHGGRCDCPRQHLPESVSRVKAVLNSGDQELIKSEWIDQLRYCGIRDLDRLIEETPMGIVDHVRGPVLIEFAKAGLSVDQMIAAVQLVRPIIEATTGHEDHIRPTVDIASAAAEFIATTINTFGLEPVQYPLIRAVFYSASRVGCTGRKPAQAFAADAPGASHDVTISPLTRGDDARI